MKIKTKVRAGGLSSNHNGIKVKSQIRPNGRGGACVRVWAIGPDAEAISASADQVSIFKTERIERRTPTTGDFEEP